MDAIYSGRMLTTFAVLVFWIGVGGMLLATRRLNRLEGRVAELEAALRGAPGAAPAAAVPPLPPAPVRWALEPPPRPEPAAVPSGAPVPPIPAAPVPSPAGGADLETQLGSRWAVWVGGVALALGGVFLVRYSIEQELIGPGLRVALGLMLAVALMLAGEWLRRRERPRDDPAVSRADIPAILTAAGTSTAFAAVYAAYGLYELIGPTTAFLLLGAISLLTMAAAVLHGPALASLGLLAALGSPLLVETSEPSPVALVLYLAFAVGAAYGVARLKLWRPLATAAAAGAWLWGFLLVVMGAGWPGAAMHSIVQLALALLFLVADPYRNRGPEEDGVDRIAALILFAFAALAVFITFDLETGARIAGFVASVAAMLVGAAVRYPAAAPGAAAAALAVVGALVGWPVASEVASEPSALGRDLVSAPLPQALSLYLSVALLLNGLVMASGLGRLALGSRLRRAAAGWYAGAATIGPLLALIVAYWRVTSFDRSLPFALLAAGLGALFALAAGWLGRGGRDDFAARIAVGATASAAVAALAAGLTFAFDKGVLTVTLALSGLGVAVVADRTAIPALRWVVGALALAVAGRLAWDPGVVGGPVGATPVLNWLLWGYGVPAAAFGAAAHILSRRGRDNVVRLVEGLALVLAALLIFLEMRHALHAGNPFAMRSSHLEAGLVATLTLGFTLLLLRLDLRQPDPLYKFGSLAFGALTLVGAGYGLGLEHNPYLVGEPVLGGPVFSSLVPAYLVPAGMAALVAALARSRRPRPFVLAAAGLALALELAFALLAVRHAFQGANVSYLRPTSQAELWCYTLVLILNGAALLAAGLLRNWPSARLAAAACLGAAVIKVFLVDLSSLDGLSRALSFVGLGLALVAVGFAYQKLLGFRAGSTA